MENKSIIYKLSRFFSLIMLIIALIVILFFDKSLDKYARILWSIPIIAVILLIIDDRIKEIENKNKILLKIQNMIFFVQWILLSSMLIITLFFDLGTISKMITLICLLALGYTAYKRYMEKNEEEIERKTNYKKSRKN